MADVIIQPECAAWRALATDQPNGTLFDHSQADWRAKTRRELGLSVDRPIIATGHQTLLWHPGILVKYLLVDAVARLHNFATANLVVDQHAGSFGSYEVPIRRSDGSLSARRIELTSERSDVPMALHNAFAPVAPPAGPSQRRGACESVDQGITRIHEAIAAHRSESNAALQMARALAELMQRWVQPMPNVTASDLIETTLARTIMQKMVDDPQRCAHAYNDAVEAFPEAGIPQLLVRDDYVELPVWRLREDGRRMRGYDNDLANRQELGARAPRLMPRALLMTALVRIGMCDLFVHGTGGANYDRAMERWIRNWLGIEVAPIAVATATLRLPLAEAHRVPVDVDQLRAQARRTWHDPEPPPPEFATPEFATPEFATPKQAPRIDAARPGVIKRELLDAVERQPRNSAGRRAAFFAMHRELERLRSMNVGRVEQAQRRVKEAITQSRDGAIASRRDWPFALYPDAMLDDLQAEVEALVRCEPADASRQ